jgi:hypothetical protein
MLFDAHNGKLESFIPERLDIHNRMLDNSINPPHLYQAYEENLSLIRKAEAIIKLHNPSYVSKIFPQDK